MQKLYDGGNVGKEFISIRTLDIEDAVTALADLNIPIFDICAGEILVQMPQYGVSLGVSRRKLVAKLPYTSTVRNFNLEYEDGFYIRSYFDGEISLIWDDVNATFVRENMQFIFG